MSRATSGSSSASLHYGILVNMHRLTRAATAFSNFSTDVLSLDLVLSRRQRSVPIRSTLSPAPHVSLQELPIEILLTIREHLFEIHRKETPNEFFAEHRAFSVCDCCDHHFDRPSDPAKWDRWDWEDHESWGCDICAELTEDPTAEAVPPLHHDSRAAYAEPASVQVEPIRRLLRAYGLALPSSTPVDTQNTKVRNYRLAVTLPPASTPAPRPRPSHPNLPTHTIRHCLIP